MIYVCSVPGIRKWDDPNIIKNILEDLETYKTRIVGLELCHNSIGEKCAQALSEKIKKLKNLRQINLSDCFVSRGKEELPKCLKFILESIIDKPIKELNLRANALGPEALSGYKLFFQKNKTLEKLYLDDCGMGTIASIELMKILKENKEMPLKVLKYSRNKIETEGCNAISDLLTEKKTLKEIIISDNEISPKGLELFFNTIKSNENITLIDTHNNTLSNQMTNFPEVISSLSNVIHLNLSDLTIQDKNIIKSIFEQLPKLKELREFHFEYNISDIDFNEKDKKAFVSDLFECLLKIKNLKEIHIGNNEIPKDIYSKYLPQFQKKGLYLFSCYTEEEKENDIMDDDLDMNDLNK